MEKYKFKLQKLLDIRVDKEEESKRHFKEAQRQKQIVEEKLNSLKENYTKYSKIDPNKTVIEQKIAQNYLNALNMSIIQTDSVLQDKISILEGKRRDLQQKQIERKTVEILKEKQQAAFIKEQDQMEQKNNDEFALYGFIRNLERR